MSVSIMKGAEPFAFDGSSTGVLLVHGFSGTPQGLREWGENLNQKHGFAVSCPRLPGHGTAPAELHGVGYTDWYEEAERALKGLLERCQSVFIGALSMGGLIAVDLAAKYSSDIAGLVLVNPFLFTNDPRAKLTPILGKLNLLIKGVYNDVADPSRSELGYSKISTKASASLLSNAVVVRRSLPKVVAPTLVFVSKQDHVVDNDCARAIVNEISSKEKEIVWLERSYHVAPLDFDRELIFEQSAKFISAHQEL